MAELATMAKYESYKDSGVDWLGEAPNHWDLLANKHIFKLKKNQVGKRSSEYDLLSLTLKGIIKRDMENPEGKFPAEFDTYQEVKKGDFVFCLFDVEETPRTVGLSAFDGMITGAYTVFEPKPDFDKNFLYYFYLNLDSKKRLRPLYRGLRNTIPKESFLGFKTFVPPMPEQTAIANFLDKKTAQIDEAIAIKEKQIELLKERKQITIQQAVIQGLNPDAARKDSGVDWIGEIPEHWNTVAIKFLVDVRDGTHDTPAYYEASEKTRYLITSKDFFGDEISFDMAKSISLKDHIEIIKRSNVETDDVLMSMIGGNIGKSVIVKKFNDFSIKNVALFKTHGDFILARFIQYYLISGLLDKQRDINSRGGAQPFMSLTDIRNLVFFKIDSSEMKDIVVFLDKKTQKLESSINLAQQQIEKLKEYKTTLINSAVTGKIKVPGVV